MGIGAALIGGGVLAGGATLLASGNASSAARDSAQIQANAANQATQLQYGIYNQTRNDLLPFQNVGRGAIPYANSLIPGGLSTANPALPATQGNATPAAGVAGNQVPVTIGGPSSEETTGITNQPSPAPNPDFDPSQPIGPNNQPRYSIPNEEGGGPRGRAGAPGGGMAFTAGGMAGAQPSGPAGFGATSGQSPFLSGVESNLPQFGSQAQNALGAFIPGSGGSPLQSALYSYVNGASYTPNPLLSAANNSILGGSRDPNSALSNLTSFSDPSKNRSLAMVNNLLGLDSSDPGARQAALEATPGYQFTLDQGLKATQNGYAAQGLGSSGAAMKGAASFATGLADQTYQSQLNNYLTNYNNQFQNAYNLYNTTSTNALNAFGQQSNLAQNAYGQGFTNSLNATNSAFNNASTAYNSQTANAQNLLNTGANAATQTGNVGQATASAAGNALVGGANAAASGIVGSTNALNAGITGVANTIAGAGTNAALFGAFGGGTLSGQAGVNALNAASLANPNNNYGSSIFTE